MQADTIKGALYCRTCLYGRGELIYYASLQKHCAVCQSELLHIDFAPQGNELPTIDEVLADPASSHWFCRALRGALTRDPVDAANDAEMLARLLDARCREILRS